MNGKQGIIALLALGLAGAQLVQSGQGARLWHLVMDGQRPQGHDMALVFGETLLIVVLIAGAGASDGFADVAITLLVALWIAWAIRHTDTITAWSTAVGASTK